MPTEERFKGNVIISSVNGVDGRPVSAGYVLVGGRSSRMGRDKALLPFRGGVLVSAIADAVSEAAGTCTLVGDPERYSGLAYRVLPDLYPGEGPLGGIVTALRDSTADWNLIVACDMPALDGSFLARIRDEAIRAGADVLLPAGPGGRPEPLCSVYHRRVLGHVEGAFARGVRKISEAVAGLRLTVFPIAEVARFQNVNTPEDWSRHAPN
jgi:molybdopterin-guanine dinucleotide biosynthesis protein A